MLKCHACGELAAEVVQNPAGFNIAPSHHHPKLKIECRWCGSSEHDTVEFKRCLRFNGVKVR